MNTMAATSAIDRQTAEVRVQLASVTDPELDESVTELGFITHVEVDAEGRVQIGFRLPTYWCAANFAFLMADDMRVAVAGLPWVTKVTIGLGEHMYADEINCGVAAGRSFQDTFGAEASGELEDIRQTFMVKAFQRRQEALLTSLLEHGLEPELLVRMSVAELAGLPDDSANRRFVERYLERRFVVGSRADGTARANEAAFVDSKGALLDADGLGVYLRALRRVGVNAEFNGALCRGLLAARYGDADADAAAPQVEIKPVHFVPVSDWKRGIGLAQSGSTAESV
ncbi:iron-sulfur cluster assembly protein [Paraburkholderia sediminicola]|uniref:metal-sulfur cluster assembly factor n=1 Tax=Paraburkholderia sediminicola TaxID=458836 RepID=UPI0038B81BFC